MFSLYSFIFCHTDIYICVVKSCPYGKASSLMVNKSNASPVDFDSFIFEDLVEETL